MTDGARGMTRAGIELVIFDCDGVLVNSEPLSVRIEVEMLAELGWPLTESEVIERFVGGSGKAMRAAIEQQLGRPLPDDWAAPYVDRYYDLYARELQAIDGIAATLEQLHVPFCVASNSSHRHLDAVLGHTGLAHHFEGRRFSAEDVAHSKPAPDLFLHAAQTMGVSPASCLVVEDSPAGVQAALAAQMHVLVFAGSIVPRDRFPDGLQWLPAMHELPDLVRERATTRQAR